MASGTRCSGTPGPVFSIAGNLPVSTATVGATLHVDVTAKDNAGNTGRVSCAYAVTYKFLGFDPPVQNGGVTMISAGDAIPLKFDLADFNSAPAGSAQSFVG